MAYNPNLYFPTNNFQPNWNYQQSITQPMMPQQTPTQPSAAPVIYVVPVKSFMEAREYKEQPGSEPPLFMLEDQPVFLKKEKDERGGEKFSAYRFTEIPLSDIMPSESNYVTKADFDAFANRVMEALNVESPAKSSESTTKAAG